MERRSIDSSDNTPSSEAKLSEERTDWTATEDSDNSDNGGFPGRSSPVLQQFLRDRSRAIDPSIAALYDRNMGISMLMQHGEMRPLPVEHLLSRLPRSNSLFLEQQVAAEYMRRQQVSLANSFALNQVPSRLLSSSMDYPESHSLSLTDRARAVASHTTPAAVTGNSNPALQRTMTPTPSAPPKSPAAPSRNRILPMSKRAPKRKATTTIRASASATTTRPPSGPSEIVFALSKEQQRSAFPGPGQSNPLIVFRPSTLRRYWDRLECRTDAMDDTSSDQSRLVRDLFSRRLCTMPSMDVPDRLPALEPRKRRKESK